MNTLAFILTTMLLFGVLGMLVIYAWKGYYEKWARKLDTICCLSTIIGFVGLTALLWGILWVAAWL